MTTNTLFYQSVLAIKTNRKFSYLRLLYVEINKLAGVPPSVDDLPHKTNAEPYLLQLLELSTACLG